MANDVFYFVKGFTGSTYYPETYKYDYTSNVWTFPSSAVVGNSSLGTAGSDNPSLQAAWDGQYLYTLLPSTGYLRLWRYDSVGNTWEGGLGSAYNFGDSSEVGYGLTSDGKGVFVLRASVPAASFRYDIASDSVSVLDSTVFSPGFTLGDQTGLAWDYGSFVYALGSNAVYKLTISTLAWSLETSTGFPVGVNKIVYSNETPLIFNFDTDTIAPYELAGGIISSAGDSYQYSTVPSVRWDKGVTVAAIDENNIAFFAGGSTSGHLLYKIGEGSWYPLLDSTFTIENGMGAYAVPIAMTSLWYTGTEAETGTAITTEVDFGDILIGDTFGPSQYQWKANRPFASGVSFGLGFPSGSDLTTVTAISSGATGPWASTILYNQPIDTDEIFNIWIRIVSVDGTNQPSSHKRFTISMTPL